MIAATKTKVLPGRLLIGGQWVDGSKKFATVNPATGEALTEIAEASREDVDRAVQAARRAFEDRGGAWPEMSASERGKLIWGLGALFERNIEEPAEQRTQDNAKLIFSALYVS